MSLPHFVLLRSLPTRKHLFFLELKTHNRLVATPVKCRSGVNGLIMEARGTIDIKPHTESLLSPWRSSKKLLLEVGSQHVIHRFEYGQHVPIFVREAHSQEQAP